MHSVHGRDDVEVNDGGCQVRYVHVLWMLELGQPVKSWAKATVAHWQEYE